MRTDRGRWLLLAAALIGGGFLTKMLQAWVIVPAFAAAYLAVGRRRLGSSRAVAGRLGVLAAAGAVLVATSMSWVVATAVWPGDKPYIGGSTDGGAWDLVIGYNGLGRIFGENGGGGPGGGGGG